MRLPFPFSTTLLQTLPLNRSSTVSVCHGTFGSPKKTFLAEPIRTVFEPHQQYLAGREPNTAVETNYLAI